MCGIAAVLALDGSPVPGLSRALAGMNRIQAHRGPDGEGAWSHPRGIVGLGHRRLAVIDVESGAQPMDDPAGNRITYNGAIYNHPELRERLSGTPFRTRSDTEVLLRSYAAWGAGALRELRGMFAFALWDEKRQTLFCARDRFGIKPLHYAVVGKRLYVASEAKALLPFLGDVETDVDALGDYLTFQFCLDGKTMFRGVHELPPGHALTVHAGRLRLHRYWEPRFAADLAAPRAMLEEKLRAGLDEAVALHLRADVPLGVSLSGGLDSSAVTALAAERLGGKLAAFTGKFSVDPAYDESHYARELASSLGIPLHEIDIVGDDFCDAIERVVYHLDFPVAGPGSFAQYMVSGMARGRCTVLLGGQGGDEMFGGYARYLIAPPEESARHAIDPPGVLAGYEPLLRELRRARPLEDLERRYFRLIDRSAALDGEIRWHTLGSYAPFDTFRRIFDEDGARAGSPFDRMMRFDTVTSLPALLHVEDRVAMAHGLESRVPLLDHPLAELAAAIPAREKIRDGATKCVLREAMRDRLPRSIVERRDKMGFPVPLHEWLTRPGRVRDFVVDMLSTRQARERDHVDNAAVVARIDAEPRFGRGLWGLLCLELWQRSFHDRAADFRRMAAEEEIR